MKILIIRTFPDILKLDSYNVQEIGLAKALIKKGHKCDIVLYHGNNGDKIEEYQFEAGGKEYSLSIYWLKGFAFLKNGIMPSVKKLIPHYDVLQVHEYEQLQSWLLYTKQKKPTVIYHGPYFDEYAEGYNLRCKVFDTFFLPLRAYKNTIALTKSKLASNFLSSKGFQNVITAGVGIDIGRFTEDSSLTEVRPLALTESEVALPEELKLSMRMEEKVPIFEELKTSEKMLLYLGKLEERRNVYLLVDIFRKVRVRFPKVRLTIIGSGEEAYQKAFLASIAKERVEGSICYLPKVSQKEAVEYYRHADLFLLPTNYEIFGMVLLEAMYFGVPVVSSQNGGSSTLISHGINGFLPKTLEADTWAACICKALEDDRLREKMGKKAKETIEKYFTWESRADIFIQAYEKAMDIWQRS